MSKITVTHLIAQLIQQGLTTQEAWWLLEKLYQQTKVRLLLKTELELTELAQAQLNRWVRQIRQEHYPIQYILGDVDFLGLKILVAPPILIPRPETEAWCATVIKQLSSASLLKPQGQLGQRTAATNLKILDLCAGTGCIGLALAQSFPASQVYAVELNPQACALITKNQTLNQVTNLAVLNLDLRQLQLVSERPVNHAQGEFLVGEIAVMVANPPYITMQEYALLEPQVRNWEDPQALVSGPDGLDLIRVIINLAVRARVKVLYLEIGYQQAGAVTVLAQTAGFQTIHLHRDLAGHDRMLELRLD